MSDEPEQKEGAQQPSEIGVYLSHIASLFVPGRTPVTFRTVGGQAAKTGDITGWTSENLDFLIEEGRRKFDQQAARFDRIRQTAQVVLPTGVALLVVAGGQLRSLRADGLCWTTYVMLVAWLVATGLVLLSTLGAAAILVAKATFGTTMPTLISQGDEGDLRREVAKSYVEESIVGEDTLNTRLTLQWWTVLFLVLGGIGFVVIWGVRIW